MRGKDSYELGDFVMVMDELAKNVTEDLTGKPYEAGDLSIEIDKRIKKAVAEFCGKEEYEFGDLSREISSRVQVCSVSLECDVLSERVLYTTVQLVSYDLLYLYYRNASKSSLANPTNLEISLVRLRIVERNGSRISSARRQPQITNLET